MEEISYIYVTDAHGVLLGTVSMRDLILAPPTRRIDQVMSVRINGLCRPDADREQVALKIAEFNLVALPVVDEQGVLLGIVTVDDVIDILQDEATEDIQRLVGAGPDESIHDEITSSLWHRHPWLQVNLLTALLASAVIFLFQRQIQHLTILAVFMPIIASMGGNAGNQTLAVAIRSLALAQIEDRDQWRICLKELSMGIINGTLIGLTAGVAAYLVTENYTIAGVVSMAMILTMGLAGLSGAFIPFFLRKLGLDPAQSSSIFLTTVTDVAGFFIFLSLGSWLLL